MPVRNPVFSQSSELPLFTKGLRFYPKLRNKADTGNDFRKNYTPPEFIMTLFVSMVANAQDFFASENDTTIMTEYNDGRLWAYRQIGDIVIGVSNYVEKNSYGKNYQILIFIKNLGESSVLFDPVISNGNSNKQTRRNKRNESIYTRAIYENNQEQTGIGYGYNWIF